MNNIQAVIAPKLKKSKTPYEYIGQTVYVFHDKENGKVVLSFSPEWTDCFIGERDNVKPMRKVATPINHFSELRGKENKVYLTLRKVFLENHPNCEANLPGCTKQATTIHHSQGRIGKRLIDVKTFVPLCGSCHRWCENNVEAAKELGLSLNRL